MANFLSTNPEDLARKLADDRRDMEEQQTQKAAQDFNLPYVNLKSFPLDLTALALMSEQDAIASESVPFYKEKHDVRIGTFNPDNQLLKQKLAELNKTDKVTLYYISKSGHASVMKFYTKVVRPTSKFSETVQVSSDQSYVEKLKSLEAATDQQAATELMTIMFGEAIAENSSDIHLEPEEKIVKVRFRVDGVLHDAVHIPKAVHRGLITRIKLMAKLKSNVSNEPQDGRFTIMNNNQPLDVRVSVLPSSFGEAVVMRLLGIGAVNLKIEDLGLVGKSLEVVRHQLHKPNGMIITTGPTGSGKTTTLYSFLKELNEPGVKIITLEDPVEYKVEGIQQTPIDHHVDFNFAKGLRAVLRQDPDVVMVGEIRDSETAETALQAALTGHVVLSTLHTNDAAGAVPRLVTMGVKNFTIAPAINAIIAQRLVRKLCPFCIIPAEISQVTLEKVQHVLNEIPKAAEVAVPAELKFYHSTGCDKCHGLGYQGRIGVYEVIEMTDEMRELVLKETSGMAIKKLAQQNGTLTMLQDGVLKALSKITDLEEIFRVVD